MQDYVVNRPEEGAMNRILAAAGDSAAGVILRLAWQAGLLRGEIQRLTWAQVDFNAQRLLLPDREVPIPPELSGWLEALRGGGESLVLDYLRRERSITRNQAAELLGVSRTTAYNRLKQLVKREKVTQIGARYYLADTVVAPEHQAEAIIAYLRREGFAYRQDIARLLNIDAVQCRPILRRLVTQGQIIQEDQKYRLP